MRIRFHKHQACGNDFIIIDESENPPLNDEERSRISQSICDRRYAIGSDSVLFVDEELGDIRMRVFERDGSESDMCGNGIRCVANYCMLRDHATNRLTIVSKDQTKREVTFKNEAYTVNLGPARLVNQYIALAVEPAQTLRLNEIILNQELISQLSLLGVQSDHAFIANTGEPHIVIVHEGAATNIEKIGSLLNSNRQLFPAGVNVNLMLITSPTQIVVRTYERGVFRETLSCGTGCTACAYIGNRIYGLANSIQAQTQGGRARIELHGDDLILTGAAQAVFDGEIDLGASVNMQSSHHRT